MNTSSWRVYMNHIADSNLILLTISLRQASSTEHRSASNTTCSYTSVPLSCSQTMCPSPRGKYRWMDTWMSWLWWYSTMSYLYCCPTALKQWMTYDLDGIKQYVLIINNVIIYQVLLGFHLVSPKCHVLTRIPIHIYKCTMYHDI